MHLEDCAAFPAQEEPGLAVAPGSPRRGSWVEHSTTLHLRFHTVLSLETLEGKQRADGHEKDG